MAQAQSNLVGQTLGRSGRRDEAQLAIDELLVMAAAGQPVHGWIAFGHMGLGDHEKALDELAIAVEKFESWITLHMHVERPFALLRGYPRFQALIKITAHAT